MVTLRSKKLKDGTRSYYLDIIYNGNRWREGLELYASRGNAQVIKEQAEEIRSQRQQQLSVSAGNVVHLTSRNKSFLDFYIEFERGYPKKDKRNLTGSLNKFCAFLKATKNTDDIKFSQLTEDVCKAFREYLISGCGLNGETPANYFTKFKLTVKEAKKKKFIKELPTEFITLGKEDGNPTDPKEVLTLEEIDKLANTPCGNEEVRRAFLFCCLTGLRTHEVRAFAANKIKYKLISVKDKGKIVKRTVPHIFVQQTKGRRPKPKLIPLSAEAFVLLGTFDNNSEAKIFNLPSETSANKTLGNWVKRAGIKKHITFYCGRHTFGTEVVAQGTDLRTAASLLGHTSLKYIMRYAHEVDKNKLSAINLLAVNLRENGVETTTV